VFDLTIIAKYFSGNCEPAEKLEMERWMNEPANEHVFGELKGVWDLSGKMKQKEGDHDLDRAWEKFSSLKTNDPSPVHSRLIRIAAAVLFIITASALFLYLKKESDQVTSPVKLMASAPVSTLLTITAVDSAVQFLLPDSTQVWLNKGGSLSFRGNFNVRHRRISLEGEGFFEVHKDPSRPFYVCTPLSVTKALGTAFNIRATAREMEIDVTNGTVELSSREGGNKMKLGAGQSGKMTNAPGSMTITSKKENSNWWRQLPCKVKRFVNRIGGD
jgi:transmembrane sensor